MRTTIGKVKGYILAYDTGNKLFHLLDSDGESVGSAKAQDDVEALAAKLSKQKFNLPIQAFTTSGMRALRPGRVTSVNPADYSVRFMYDEQQGYRSHTKMSLRHSHLYEATDRNQQIASEIKICESKVNGLDDEIRNLILRLEKPINLAYFNLEG